jgi:hypothetical protein
MKRLILLGAMAGVVLVSPVSGAAQDRGQWSAANSPAKTITGDISITDSRVFINLLGFPTAPIRKLEPTEVSAVFVAEGSRGAGGNLYRLNIPATRRFLNHNSLCGSEDTEWMVTNVSGKSLQVAFFSGTSLPVFTPEAMNNSTDLCGTFSYVR